MELQGGQIELQVKQIETSFKKIQRFRFSTNLLCIDRLMSEDNMGHQTRPCGVFIILLT